ncbi:MULTISPECIES: SDR family oxidoreductase [Mesorhizobium]|uniref:SDR family oxidoreductase n=1 Tax=Mesorhizobium sp. TaxID=1871066 RepID=UPI000A07C4C9|nr:MULTISPECIES: SDR family oxidoreductase [Mesorhizobium]RWM69006.1 MAG: SDR family oxidoreductase [Mesorhizobium sp.]TIO23803.1 MAG: SDR family oxidoreductase [Mesorhizobium sp.]TJV59458.1 MAG: SDR family oxidoreductase [Mesorhizobium sp.]
MVVVGASSGIGHAVAWGVAARGAEGVMMSRSMEKLQRASEGMPGHVRLHAADMRDAVGVANALADYDTIDHLVLTAVADELARAKPLADLTDEDVERSFDKMRGYFTVVQAAAHRLSPTGSIVMMCGAAAVRPPAMGFSLLAAEGASIPGFGKALARELSPVRVTVVMAGLVDTPINSARREQSAKWAETSLPARRFGQPEDLADAIIFAMRNPYTTGGILVVDGGLLIA